MSSPATNWGQVEQDVVRHIRSEVEDDFARYVKPALSEGRADEVGKGYNSIYTVSGGTVAARAGRGGGGHIDLNEDWRLFVLIYAQDGRVDDEARFGAKGIHAVAAMVKGALNGYTPNYQDGNTGFLELVRDEPVAEYHNEAGTVGHKIRQTYILRTVLNTRVTGDSIAA